MGWNVYVTRKIPLAGIDLLHQKCETVEVNQEDRVLSREELLSAVAGRDGVLCLLTDRIDDEVMAAAGPQCKVFANYAVGYDNIDMEAARRRGVRVSNTPDVLTDATADMAWALLFAAARRIPEGDRLVRDGAWTGWAPMQLLGQEITRRTLGVVGGGRIGTNFALKSAGFNMRVLYADIATNTVMEGMVDARKVELDDLLKRSDFISLHVPLTDQTHHLIAARELEMMKSTAVLINTGRARRLRERADAGRGPGRTAQRRHLPAHRQRDRADAQPDGHDRGGEPDRRAGGA